MNPLRTFLTEENIISHREYMRTLRLRHSIAEKSIPEIKGKSLAELEKLRLSQKDRREIIPNYREYLAHKLYFSSFCECQRPEPYLKKYYSSTEAFLYEIHLLAMSVDHGFIFISLTERGMPDIFHKTREDRIKTTPVLALDLSEHAYFLDYRFDKEAYVRGAISHLDLSLLDKSKK